MKIADVAEKNGIIIETVIDGIPSGNVYKISGRSKVWPSCVIAWKQYRGGKIFLHANNHCRILDDKPYSGQYGPF